MTPRMRLGCCFDGGAPTSAGASLGCFGFAVLVVALGWLPRSGAGAGWDDWAGGVAAVPRSCCCAEAAPANVMVEPTTHMLRVSHRRTCKKSVPLHLRTAWLNSKSAGLSRIAPGTRES